MPEPTPIVAAVAFLVGVSSSVSFVLGWALGRRDLHREQFRMVRDHRRKHEQEHGR